MRKDEREAKGTSDKIINHTIYEVFLLVMKMGDDEILKYEDLCFAEENSCCSKNISGPIEELISEYEMSNNSSSNEEESFEKKNMKTVPKKSKNKKTVLKKTEKKTKMVHNTL